MGFRGLVLPAAALIAALALACPASAAWRPAHTITDDAFDPSVVVVSPVQAINSDDVESERITLRSVVSKAAKLVLHQLHVDTVAS